MFAFNHDSELTDRLATRSRFRVKNSTKKKVLFATDFSPSSRAGLRWATSLAKSLEAELLIVHVDATPTPDENLLHEEYRHGRATANARLHTLEATDPDVPCRHKVLFGDPATEILWLAEQEEVDLMVLGTHARTGFLRLFHRSVAKKVLGRASCPVLVVRSEVNNV